MSDAVKLHKLEFEFPTCTGTYIISALQLPEWMKHRIYDLPSSNSLAMKSYWEGLGRAQTLVLITQSRVSSQTKDWAIIPLLHLASQLRDGHEDHERR